ncbi:MAG: RNA-directed DNA polymerase [Oceanipulchritudo sp.]
MSLPWFERIIRSHNRDTGRGLPIGSLSSQHLANFYLSPLDRLCQSLPGVRGYVRYMDDFVCWADSKESLLLTGKRIEAFVSDVLGLTLKHSPAPQRTEPGMDFLGFRIFPTHTRLNRRSKVRYRRKIRTLAELHESDMLSEFAIQQRLTALTAFTLPASSWQFRLRTLQSFRSAAIGHEPGEPGRQLQQQRAELPLRQPQQQQPGQPQQQHGLPPRPQLGPTPPDGAIRHHQGTEPAAVPIPYQRDKANLLPARAGRPAEAGSNARSGILLDLLTTC